MEERNTHIDQWLQQAAVRQEQETASPQEKQAGWAALQGMLPPAPRRLPRWLWLGGVVLMGVMGYVLFDMRPWAESQLQVDSAGWVNRVDVDESMGAKGKDTQRGNGPGTDNGRDESAGAKGKDRQRENGPGTDSGRDESTGAKGKDTQRENGPGTGSERDESTGAKGKDRGSENEAKNRKEAGESVSAKEKSTPSLNTPRMDYGKNKSAGAKGVVGAKNNDWQKKNEAAENNLSPRNAHHPAPATIHMPGAQVLQGDHALKNTVPSSPAALSAAATIHRSISNPETSLTRSLPPAIRLRPPAGTSFHKPPTGFSLKWAGTVPQNSVYAFNPSAAYTFPLSKQLSLRPYIGGGYMGGFNLAYQHRAFYERPNGGSGNRFWIDSIVTDFNATSAWLGEGGLQVAYGYRKWELFAGIAYQCMLKVNGRRDSVFTARIDTIHLPAYQPQLFSTGSLPGRGRLVLQAGVNYGITPQWQAGLQYNMQLQAQPAGRGFMGNAPVLPFSSSLEIQVRWYFRKKNFQGTQPLP